MAIIQAAKNHLKEQQAIKSAKEVKIVLQIANKLRGTYKPEEYGNVIIPMVIIRRFECALEDTRDDVVTQFKSNPNTPESVLQRKSGYQFYNTSEYSLKKLLDDGDNIKDNFEYYLNSFSKNVKGIVTDLKFFDHIQTLNKANKLYLIVKDFSELDLHPSTVDNVKMGYIFEEILRRYSENGNAGDHYTPREVISCLVNVLLAEGSDDVFEQGKVVTVGDFACGTGGMLSTTFDFIKANNPSANIRLFGQEIFEQSHAICLADMLIKGQDTRNIIQGNTMLEDAFPDNEMRFVIMNPPFGESWGKDKDSVTFEAVTSDQDRFGTKLPGISDMQLLFIKHALYKLDKQNGRAAIITNGTPLFTGGTASGESQIRRELIENDLIEAIIGFPNQLFYNTGISIYAFILSNNKDPKRKGKIQLIDATNFYHKMKKSLGDKRNELSDEDIVAITKIYQDFEGNEYSKIFRNEEFLYKEFSIYQPMQRNYSLSKERIKSLIDNNVLANYYDEYKLEELNTKLENHEKLTPKEKTDKEKFEKNKKTFYELIQVLLDNADEIVYKEPMEFIQKIYSITENIRLYPDKKTLTEQKKLIREKIVMALSTIDKSAEIHLENDGSVMIDPLTKEIELVPYLIDEKDYFNREVYPYLPDAIIKFEEDLKKTRRPTKAEKEKGETRSVIPSPIIKVGAEFPFTRYFYKDQTPENPEDLLVDFSNIESELNKLLVGLK